MDDPMILNKGEGVSPEECDNGPSSIDWVDTCVLDQFIPKE
jgi:hypothetical protein